MTVTYTDADHHYLIYNVRLIHEVQTASNKAIALEPPPNEFLICYVDNDAGVELEQVTTDIYKPIHVYKI